MKRTGFAKISQAKDAQAKPSDTFTQDDFLRRLQIGLTGVLTVLVLVGLGGLINDQSRENAIDAAPADRIATTVGQEQEANTSLAELGVQPATLTEEAKAPVSMAPLAEDSGAAVPDLQPNPELERPLGSATTPGVSGVAVSGVGVPDLQPDPELDQAR